jgi:toxin ParE1/3/4
MDSKAQPYRLSPLAMADLEAIWLYSWQNWSAQQADIYVSEIVAAFNGLRGGQKKGRKVTIRNGYWKYAVKSHVIFYRVTTDYIHVIRILHQNMDVERHI